MNAFEKGGRGRGPARFRPSRFDVGRFPGINRYGEERIHPSSYEDERGMRHWSDDLRSEASQERNFRGKGPKNYIRTDERIKEAVCERLTYSHDVDATDFEVHVSEGLVTLSGTVNSRQEKRLAEYLIEDLPGVVDVHNHLTVRKNVEGWIPTHDEREDKEDGQDFTKAFY